MSFELFARSDTGSSISVTTITAPNSEITVAPIDLLLWNKLGDLNNEELRTLVSSGDVILSVNNRDLNQQTALFALEGQNRFSTQQITSAEDLMALTLYVANACTTELSDQLGFNFYVDGFHTSDNIDLAESDGIVYISGTASFLFGIFTVIEDFENNLLPGWSNSDNTNTRIISYSATPYEGDCNCYWYTRGSGSSLGDTSTYDMGSGQDWRSIQEISWWHRAIVNPTNTPQYKVRLIDTSANTVLSVQEFAVNTYVVSEWHNVTKNPQSVGDFAAETGSIDWAQIRYFEFEVTTEGPGSINYASFDYITVTGTDTGNVLQSKPFSMGETPNEILVKALGTIESGIQLSVSRDGGTTFTNGDLGEWIDVSGQPSGSSLVLKMTTTDTDPHCCEGWGAVWR